MAHMEEKGGTVVGVAVLRSGSQMTGMKRQAEECSHGVSRLQQALDSGAFLSSVVCFKARSFRAAVPSIACIHRPGNRHRQPLCLALQPSPSVRSSPSPLAHDRRRPLPHSPLSSRPTKTTTSRLHTARISLIVHHLLATLLSSLCRQLVFFLLLIPGPGLGLHVCIRVPCHQGRERRGEQPESLSESLVVFTVRRVQ